jgi:hypothetical protein
MEEFGSRRNFLPSYSDSQTARVFFASSPLHVNSIALVLVQLDGKKERKKEKLLYPNVKSEKKKKKKKKKSEENTESHIPTCHVHMFKTPYGMYSTSIDSEYGIISISF